MGEKKIFTYSAADLMTVHVHDEQKTTLNRAWNNWGNYKVKFTEFGV
jgi:hypothetical protein